MQLRYVGSELSSGLKRNVSMTLAVILTIWISLTLVALGLLMRSQVGTIEKYFGSQLEVQVAFCGPNSHTAQCVAGEATRAQEVAVRKVIAANPEVASYRYRSREEAYQGFIATHTNDQGQADPIAKEITVKDMPTAYWVKFKNPNQTQGLISAVDHLPGVDQIIDLRKELDPVYRTLNMLKWMALGGAALLVLAAVLQVSNTIRLAALARRREIGIMRLVGASSIYIQLPFVLEVVVSALLGAVLACGSVVVVMRVFVPWLQSHLKIWPWVSWSSAWEAMVSVVVIAVALAVLPTLLMTRKYLRV
ncbi:MAG TPA: permease-like cell division protein FtsX [Nocardioidaceae bacterium]|nr:permease-like cell division protein FtsX [Nocardioidaceae bacterium]